MAAAAAARWRAAGGSVRGSTHRQGGLPNQDSVAFELAPSGLPATAAVADGHGGARHFRSADGARLAVQAANAVLHGAAPDLDAATGEARMRMAAVELPRRIVEHWLHEVHEALAARPIGDDEWQVLQAAEGEDAVRAVRADPVLAYGATLLAALATTRGLLLLQLGDGDLLAVAADGSTQRPVPPDERLAGHLTTSLCRPGAETDFRCALLDAAAAPALLLLSTDGYANSFRTDADYLKLGADFLALIRGHGLAAVEQQLGGILEHASTHGSGDDITLAMLVREPIEADGDRRPVSVERTERPQAAATASAAAPVSELRHARRGIERQRGLIVALLGLLLAGTLWTQRERLAPLWRGGAAPALDEAAAPRLPGPGGGRDDGPLAATGPLPPAVALGADRPLASTAAAGGMPSPAALLAASRPVPVRALSIATIGALRGSRVAGGVEVRARIELHAARGRECTARAAVYGADDRELGAASSKVEPAVQGGQVAADLRLLVPTPKDAALAAAMREGAGPRYALRVDCARERIAETDRLPLDG